MTGEIVFQAALLVGVAFESFVCDQALLVGIVESRLCDIFLGNHENTKLASRSQA